jgi:CheY-like chemotaxis protein
LEKRLKVVVVDDDEIQLTVLKAWLGSQGHTVVTQNGPVGTTNTLLQEQPDIVLLDVVMPGLTGDALLLLLGRVASAVKLGVIFYSANEPPSVAPGPLRILGAMRKTNQRTLFLSEFDRLVTSALSQPATSAEGAG